MENLSGLGEMGEESASLFLTFTVVIGYLLNENPGSRERLIDRLLEHSAKFPEEGRRSLHAQQIAALTRVLEDTQFPTADKGA